ncbi:MAG: FecR domain-containing protein [Campylobacterales bacterium]
MRMVVLALLLAVSLMAEGVARLVSLEGEVHIRRANMLMLSKAGMEMTVQDVIDSREDGRARIVFHDETVVTVGPNTTFAIEAFVNENEQASLQLESRRGALRVITGQIGKIAPDQFKVRTRTATIGVRGTQFVVAIESGEESILCTDGSVTLTPLKTRPSYYDRFDWAKPPFQLGFPVLPPAAPKTQTIVLEAGEVATATFAETVAAPEVPELAAPAPIAVVAFAARRATQEEAEAIVEQTADEGGVVLDRQPVINEYREIMNLPPEEPLIIRPLDAPAPSDLGIPRLKDRVNPDDLRRDLQRNY